MSELVEEVVEFDEELYLKNMNENEFPQNEDENEDEGKSIEEDGEQDETN